MNRKPPPPPIPHSKLPWYAVFAGGFWTLQDGPGQTDHDLLSETTLQFAPELDANGKIVLTESGLPPEEVAGNARLAIAAPRMYAALRQYLAAAAHCHHSETCDCYRDVHTRILDTLNAIESEDSPFVIVRNTEVTP